MKKYLLSTFTFLLTCGQFTLYSQSNVLLLKSKDKSKLPLVLSVVNHSLEPHSSDIKNYKLQIVNHFDKALIVKISSENILCDKDKTVNADFIQHIYYSKPGDAIEAAAVEDFVTIQANSTLEFYVRLTRSANTILNSWNCTEVKAKGVNNDILSNSILIESFIPDSKNFR